MSDVALEVPEGGPRDGQDPHAGDDQRDLGHIGDERRLRDQVGGHRHQGNVRADGEEAQQRSDRDPATARAISRTGGGRSSRAVPIRRGIQQPTDGPSRPATRPACRSRRRARDRARRRRRRYRRTGGGARRPGRRGSPASRPTASRMPASLAGSRCEVASSRMTSRASARNARAIASRWRWPPLRGRPLPLLACGSPPGGP